MVLHGKCPQEYPVNAGVQGSILGPTLLLLYIKDLPDDAICNIAICADEQLELASELESDLQDTVDWDKKWLLDFNVEKTQLVLFNQPIKTGSINVKMDGSVIEKKSSFKMLRLTFSSKLDWGSYIISSAKITSKIIRALNRYMKFLSAEVAVYLYKFDITNIIVILPI